MSAAMKIHISKAMKLLLDDSNIYTFESRGQICVKVTSISRHSSSINRSNSSCSIVEIVVLILVAVWEVDTVVFVSVLLSSSFGIVEILLLVLIVVVEVIVVVVV